MLRSFESLSPRIDPSAFVADSADVIGNVVIGAQASILYQVVLRGDNNLIEIGQRTNVQDGTIVHCDADDMPGCPVRIGSDVSIGHGARLHGCTIGDRCLIGIGAIILDGVEIGEDSLVAAGALIPPGKKIPAGSLVIGNPAVVKRDVRDSDRALIGLAARTYVELGARHRGA